MNKATFYIGIERDSAGRQIDAEQRARAMDTLRRRAARAFGGYSIGHIEGGWMDGNTLVAEGALRVEVYTDQSAAQCRIFAEQARELFAQSCVLMDFTGAPGAVFVQRDAPSKAAA